MPWPFAARQPADLGGGWWDCHCHILPGLDDGPSDLETAVEMVRLACAHGTATLVATPHAIAGLYPTTRDGVLTALEELRAACEAEGVAAELHPGQEIALEPDIPERLAAGELLTYADAGTAALIELPAFGVPPFCADTFFRLRLRGVLPVVAHAERTSLVSEPAELARLIDAGARLQLNAAVFGARGSVRKLVLSWVRQGWVVCLGSDGHSLGRRPPILDPAVAAGIPELRPLLDRPGFLDPAVGA